MPWLRLTVGAALGRTVAAWRHCDALSHRGRRLTWQALDRWSDRLALALLAQGIGKGTTVATLMPNSVEWVALFLAIGKIGAVVVPLNLRYKARELAYVLKESDAATLVAVMRHGDRNYASTVADALKEAQTPLVVTLGASELVGAERELSWEAFEAGIDTDSQAGVDRLNASKAVVTPDDLLMIQFTSGTTAAPKGVELRQDQLLRSATGMSERLGMTAHDRFFSPMPFFHIGGSTASVLTAMVCGATLYFTDRFDAGEAIATISGERCTCVCGVETMFVDMLAHETFGRADLSCIRTGWTNYNERVFAALPGMLNVYALTECSSVVTICHWTDPLERRCTSGYSLDGLEVRVVDPDTRESLPAGEAGLILVRGWCVTTGYYGQPPLAASGLSSDRWFDTGDYGLVKESGDLLYLGRLKDVLRVGGENVSSVEVEAIVNMHPAVLRCAVVPVPDSRLKQIPLVFVLLREAASATEQEIIAHCIERLANFKVPRHVVFVTEFPMTESGKIQKRLLVQQAEAWSSNRNDGKQT